MLKKFILLLFCGVVVSLLARPSPSLSEKEPVDFAKDIQPILQQACYPCHGPEQTMAELRLDVKGLALRGGVSGPVIVPGNSQESRLVKRILGLGGEARMPFGRDPLSEEQIARIRTWIDQGAVWPADAADAGAKPARHWAYVKPVRPNRPPVKDKGWVRNPIDQFVLARLEKEGLRPSPEADKATLIRRVYLDLMGLPPSIKEVDDFLADRRADAYEKVVDRLLASPHYGERWARPWLDLARYADSNGYEKDRPREMWRYRDWVIDALNQDMPFDRFTIEQIAGDMLPNPTQEQKIATGFHRNTMLNEEGGVDKEEARWVSIVDRVGTTATVWLGTTLACAQCHNHKYDPFSQKDFYRMFAFFENADEPKLDLPTREQEVKRKAIEDEIKELEKVLKRQTPELDAAQAEWEGEMLSEPTKWTALDPVSFESTSGSTLTKLSDKSLLASGASPEKDTYVIVARSELREITGLRIEALPDSKLPKGGPGRDPYGNFLLTGVEITAGSRDRTEAAQPLEFKTVKVDDSAYRFDETTLFKDDAASTRGPRRGWAIDATRDPVRTSRQMVFELCEPFGFQQQALLTIKLKHLGGALGQGIGRVRLSVTAADDPLRIISVPAKLRAVLETPPAQRTKKQREDLAEQYRAVAPSLKSTRDRLAKLRESLKKLGIVSTFVMRERLSFERPSTYLRVRGEFLSKGDKVYAGTPAILPPLTESQPVNRLGLARWLVGENNPLTARVTVNRFWEQFFGRGIVETSEDFGTQGERPSHPELLDWLTTEFLRQEWRMKAIHRLIVTSATYRQASAVTPELLARDPYNRLLARGPRFRIEAEMVRDVMLAASGLLCDKIGGPSVFPPQPDGIWRNPYSDDKWVTSRGEDRYRRGIYTFWRRTAAYPTFMTFDAPSREVCTVRRVRTNTPLQALAALNDEASFEAAQHLAKRMLLEARGDVPSRATYGFRLCVARAPKPEELNRLVDLYTKELDYFRQKPEDARKTVNDSMNEVEQERGPELAAWAIVANVLLNLDETLTKE